MLFIVEILFFGMGVYGLITAKLPSWFVGKGYIAKGGAVRLLSLLMIFPLPTAFCAGFVLGLINSDYVWIASALEIFMILVAAIIVTVTLKNIRKPEQPLQAPNQGIQEQ